MSTVAERVGMNIKGLVIDEPERAKSELDPVALLIEDDWAEIKEQFEFYISQDQNAYFSYGLEFATSIKFIAPKRLSYLNIENYFERIKGHLKKHLKKGEKKHFFASYLLNVALFRQLFGKEKSSIFYAQHKKIINEELGKRNKLDLTPMVIRRLLFPEEEVKNYVTENYWEYIKNDIKQTRDTGNWGSISYLSSMARLLFPDRFSEISNQDDLVSIYQALIISKNRGKWSDFLPMAWHLKILSADEVKVTDEGIQLINHAPMIQDILSIPERRKF